MARATNSFSGTTFAGNQHVHHYFGSFFNQSENTLDAVALADDAMGLLNRLLGLRFLNPKLLFTNSLNRPPRDLLFQRAIPNTPLRPP